MKTFKNKKIVLGTGAMACFAGIVALCSFFPFVIDPSKWQTAEFLSDTLIVVAIVIFCTICVMFMGQASNAMNPSSQIAKARVAFTASSSEIIDGKKMNAFSQWVRKSLQPSDLKNEKERALRKAGIEQMGVLDLEDAEIRSLKGKPQKIGDMFFKSLTKAQVASALRAKKLKMTCVAPTYYLFAKNGDDDKTITERSATEAKKKGVLLSWSLLSRIVLTLVISMIFTSLVYDMGGGGSQEQAWLKFVSRLLSMVTSAFMGWILGCQMNDIDAQALELKTFVHKKFFEDSSFKALTLEEEAKEEFKERVRSETLKLGYSEKDA